MSSALQASGLNNVLQQYFPGAQVTASPLGSRIIAGAPPRAWSKGDMEGVVAHMAGDGTLEGVAPNVVVENTIFNFMLPHGSLLFSDLTPTGNAQDALDQPLDASALRAAVEQSPHVDQGQLRDEEDSLHSLAGYHGSVPLAGGKFAYYAIGVYSQVLTRSRTNGIPAFDQSWKDIVATFYHELCESRSNPDVEEVNRTGNDSLLGWYADKHG